MEPLHERLARLRAADALDEEGRITLLRVAKSLAAQVAKEGDSGEPAVPKGAAVACVARLSAKRGRRR